MIRARWSTSVRTRGRGGVRGGGALRPRRAGRGRPARAARAPRGGAASRSRRWSRRSSRGRSTPRSTDLLIRPGRVMSAEEIAARGRDQRRPGPPHHARRGRPGRGRLLPGERPRHVPALRRRRRAVRRAAHAAVHPRGRVVDGPGGGRRGRDVPRRGGGTVAAAGCRLDAARRGRRRMQSRSSTSSRRSWPGMFRLHIQAAVTRQRIVNRSTEDPSLFRLAIGFVDLVGFTPYTESARADEVADLVDELRGARQRHRRPARRPGGEAHRRRGDVRRGRPGRRLRHRVAPGRELRGGPAGSRRTRASASDRSSREVATTTARWSTSRRASRTWRCRVRCW